MASVDWKDYIDATVAGELGLLSWTAAAASPDLYLAAVPLLDLALHIRIILSKAEQRRAALWSKMWLQSALAEIAKQACLHASTGLSQIPEMHTCTTGINSMHLYAVCT